jgi:hypothetical protein
LVLLFVFQFFPSAMEHWLVILASIGVINGIALVVLTLARVKLFPSVVSWARGGLVSGSPELGRSLANLFCFDGLQLFFQWILLANLIAASFYVFQGDPNREPNRARSPTRLTS